MGTYSDIKRKQKAVTLLKKSLLLTHFLLQVPAVCEDVCVPQYMCKICNQA